MFVQPVGGTERINFALTRLAEGSIATTWISASALESWGARGA